MQRLVMSLVLIAMLVVAALTAAPLIMSMDGYKSALISAIKSSTGLDAEINGDVKVSFLPFPAIEVSNVAISSAGKTASAYIFYVESIQVDSSFKSVLTGQVDLRSIKLNNPVIELEKMKDGTNNWQFAIDAFENHSKNSTVKLPDKITINNGTIAYREKDKKRTVDYISAKITADSAEGPFAISGNFSSNEMVVKFDTEIGKMENGSKSHFTISSDDFSLKIEGQYTAGDNPSFAGEVDGRASNLGNFVKTFFDVNSSFSKIKSNERLDILGGFNISKKAVKFTDVAITSDSVKGRANINAIISSDGVFQWDAELDMDKIDFDALAADDEKKSEKDVDYYASTLNTTTISDYKFDIPQNINVLMNIQIKDMMYKTEKISELELDADVFGGKAVINYFSAALPGNSKLEFNGSVDNNGTRPILSGLLSLSGSSLRDVLTWLDGELEFIPEGQMGEYLLTSNLKMTPLKIDISDIHLSVDRTLITGDISMRPVRTVPMINVDLSIDRFDFDRYNFTSRITKRFEDFIKNISGQNLETSWLYMLGNRMDFNIDAKELQYNNHQVDSAFLSLVISRGTISIPRFMINSKAVNMDSNALVDIVSDKPSIQFNISASDFDTSFFIKSETDAKQEAKTKGLKWSEEPFNMLGIDRFSGRTNIVINNFKHKNVELGKLRLSGVLDRQVFNIDEATAEMLGGEVEVKGSVGVSQRNPSFGLAVILSNLELGPFVKLFQDDVETSGRFFLSGTARTFGPSPLKWMSELVVDGKFAARGLTVNKFDLNSIVSNAARVYSVIDMDVIVKKAMTEGSVMFDTVEGNVATASGVLKAVDLKFESNIVKGAMAGNVSLINGDVKGVANIVFRPEAEKQVNLGMNLAGTIDNVQRNLDTSQLESYITAKGGR